MPVMIFPATVNPVTYRSQESATRNQPYSCLLSHFLDEWNISYTTEEGHTDNVLQPMHIRWDCTRWCWHNRFVSSISTHSHPDRMDIIQHTCLYMHVYLTMSPVGTMNSVSSPHTDWSRYLVPRTDRTRPCDVLNVMLQPKYCCQFAVKGRYFTENTYSLLFKSNESGDPPSAKNWRQNISCKLIQLGEGDTGIVLMLSQLHCI